MAKPPPLPKRFEPLLAQVQNEAALRYGSQESGLLSILGQLSRQHDRSLQAQQTANMGLLGSLKGADTQLQGFYNDAGITPQVQATLVGTPTGARLAGELASARVANQSALLGAQASNEYNTNKLNSDFGDQVQQVNDQLQAEQKERGIFSQGQFDSLIKTDRDTRHAANVALTKQQHDDLQATQDRQASLGNALIGQGLQPVLGADGSVTVGAPLPGGKADPNAPGNQAKKPKRTTGPGTAPADAQRTAGTQFSTAIANAQKGLHGKPRDPDTIQQAVDSLTAGRPAQKGGVIYDTVPVKDNYGRDTGKTKQVPRLDPKTGQRVTAPSSPAIPGVPRPIAQAAAEQAVYGYVTTATVRALQKLGYSVNQIPGLVTQHGANTERSQTTGTPEPAPRNAHGHI